MPPTDVLADRLDRAWLRSIVRAVRVAYESGQKTADFTGYRPPQTPIESALFDAILSECNLRSRSKGAGLDPLKVNCRILDTIEQHAFERDCSPAILAHSLGLSKTTLLRHCRALTGHATMEHIHHLRVSRARCELVETRLPVKEIAWRVGYANSKTLCRHFLAVVGCRPSGMRAGIGASQR